MTNSTNEDPDESPAAGAQLSRPSHGALTALCRELASDVGVDGASVSVLSDAGSRELISATDALAQHLDDIQFTAGVGPCIDAYTTDTPVLCSDLKSPAWTEKWFGFVDAAIAAGIESVYAYPLRGGPVVFGVLELYRVRAQDLSVLAQESVRAATQSISSLVLDRFAQGSEVADAVRDSGSGMFDSEHARPQVNHAAGMVSVQLDVGIADAMASMRARAYLEQRSIVDIADSVVARRIRFTEFENGRGDRHE